MNTDIHRSRSGLGHRVGATERRPRRVRCSGPQQRPAARHRLQILHAAPYATHPPPTSGGNAPTRSSPTPTPSPSSRTRGADLHGHHGGTASAVAARRARSGRAARGRNGRCRPLRGTSSSDRPRRRSAGGQLPGHRRPRTPSPARHEPADPGRRRQRDDQRGRAELRVRRCPPARRSSLRDQRDLDTRNGPGTPAPKPGRQSVPRWRGPSASRSRTVVRVRSQRRAGVPR